ncbi:MAG TPA: PKD domain-containing protein [Candidatus Thermoplasmatota archaeon]|nr:PKD domain-containing protein [Candidatus Thermoplasmatota archaeon]
MRRAVLAAFLVAIPGALAAPETPDADAADGGPSGAPVPVAPARAVTAPPVVTLVRPQDGVGASGILAVAGVALDNDSSIDDVQLRIDRGGWASVDVATRSSPFAAGFQHAIDLSALPPGEHLVEVRAFDGGAYSLPVPARVKTAYGNAPPTVTMETPRDGDSIGPGERVTVAGTATDADGKVEAVHVRVDDGAWTPATLSPAGTWRADLFAEPGIRRVEARASDDRGETSIAASARLAIGNITTPPAVDIVAPTPRAGFTDSGSPGCACVRLRGVAHGPGLVHDVLVAVDDGAEIELAETPGATLRHLEGGGAEWEWDWPSRQSFEGPHRFTVRAAALPERPGLAPEVGVPETVDVAVGSARAFSMRLTPTVVYTGDAFRLQIVTMEDVREATWRIEDGAPIEGLDVTASVPVPGIHEVSVRIADRDGHTGYARSVVQVLNRAPTAEVALETGDLRAGTVATFNASRSTDADGSVMAWKFEFGDGLATPWLPAPVAEHAYLRRGYYVATALARDDLGAVGATRLPVIVLNSPPTLEASASDRNATTLYPVQFQAKTTDADLDPVLVRWEFGDGSASNISAPLHAYKRRGQYAVAVSATDPEGAVASDVLYLDIGNLPATANFTTEPEWPTTRDAVRFLDASTKKDGDIVLWRWDFGDGNVSSSRAPTHQYARAGSYVVRLNVTDDWGATVGVSRTLSVGNGDPAADFFWVPDAPSIADAVRFRSLSQDFDGSLVEWWWDFGDGNSAEGALVAHTFSEKRAYNVTLRVLDDAGATAAFTRVVNVVNAIPDVTLPGGIRAVAGRPVVLEGVGTDRDGRIELYLWDTQGDGFEEYRGTDPKLVWTYATPGRYIAKFTAIDDDGARETKGMEVLVEAPPPAFLAPSVSILDPARDATLTGAVLVAGTSNDDIRVARVEWQVRQSGYAVHPPTGWFPARGAVSWSADLDTRNLGNGAFELVARAFDGGLYSDEDVRRFSVRNDPQETSVIALQILAPAPGQLVSGRVQLQGTSYHPEGVSRVALAAGDAAFEDVVGTLAWSHLLDTRNLSAGAHVLRIRAYHGDALYREERVTIVVNNDPPTVWIDPAPLKGAVRGLLQLSGLVAMDHEAERILLQVDDGAWQEAFGTSRWKWAFDTTRLVDGSHNLTVKAVGVDGIESAPERIPFRVANAAVAPVDPPRIEDERDAGAASLLVALLAIVVTATARRITYGRRR